MLNKKVLLGVLVAGAMALPLTASAGVVQGTCVTCHTMHNSQNGTNMGNAAPQATLLRGGGCEACHAGGVNAANGVDASKFNAPQVDDAARPNLAGWFTDGATSQNHNITGDLTGAVADPFPTAPGSVVTNVTCAGCHVQSTGGHHGQGGLSYRMLFTVAGTDQVEDSSYGNAQTAAAVDVSDTTYDSDAMNGVCAGCHGDFHGGTDQLSGSSWIRHPTDLRLADAIVNTNYNYAANYAANGDDNVVPLGTSSTVIRGTAGTGTLMCITCHFSHGSNQPDLLRFAYDASNNVAGNASGSYERSVGCESCHSYQGNAAVGNQAGM